jgi:hypothetical protein
MSIDRNKNEISTPKNGIMRERNTIIVDGVGFVYFIEIREIEPEKILNNFTS